MVIEGKGGEGLWRRFDGVFDENSIEKPSKAAKFECRRLFRWAFDALSMRFRGSFDDFSMVETRVLAAIF